MSSAKVINFDLPKSRYVVPTRILFFPNWSASHIDFMLLLSINTSATSHNFRIAKSYLYSLIKRKATYFPSAFVPAVAGHSVALPQNEAIGLL